MTGGSTIPGHQIDAKLCRHGAHAHVKRLSTAATSTFRRTGNAQAICESLDGPLAFKAEQLVEAEVQPHDVVVDVHSAGINFKDILQCAGRYQQKLEPPFVPGSEAAGTVVAVGSSVNGLDVGDEVVSMAPQAFQKYHVASQDLVFKIPDSADSKRSTAERFDEAAAILCTHGTAYLALTDRTQLQPGEHVLVTAAGGGVGLGAVALAKHMGAKVIAAASSNEKLDLAKRHGADYTIDYTKTDLRKECDLITGKQGVDVAIDMCGGEVFKGAFKSLGWGGRLCVIGFASGDIPTVNAGA